MQERTASKAGWLPKVRRSASLRGPTNNPANFQIQRMIEEMPYIQEHLSSLRQEIADLRSLNTRFAEKGAHTELDQTAFELRTKRLNEIKQELSKMLSRPEDPKIWWERSRRHLTA